jgi:scyllo-inositol 2-dehydrogenase (NADP+)
MRVVVVGLGVQGRKRTTIAGPEVVATVDPVLAADYRRIEDVPLNSFDAALLCVPDAPKVELLTYLLGNGKHALVEKPLLSEHDGDLSTLAALSAQTGAVCYTAYNHRFEPHFMRMRDLIHSGRLGQIYTVRMFYGNGTAAQVKASPWRDTGTGVLFDLGSHLLDTLSFWLGAIDQPFRIISASRFENRSFDHVTFGASGTPLLQLMPKGAVPTSPRYANGGRVRSRFAAGCCPPAALTRNPSCWCRPIRPGRWNMTISNRFARRGEARCRPTCGSTAR